MFSLPVGSIIWQYVCCVLVWIHSDLDLGVVVSFYIALAGLELTVSVRLTLNLQRFSEHLLSEGWDCHVYLYTCGNSKMYF